jgi:hypothetical protein
MLVKSQHMRENQTSVVYLFIAGSHIKLQLHLTYARRASSYASISFFPITVRQIDVFHNQMNILPSVCLQVAAVGRILRQTPQDGFDWSV